MPLHSIRTSMRTLLAAGTVILSLASGASAQTNTTSGVEMWKTLPPTPVALSADANGLPVQSDHIRMDDGAKIYYAQAGEGEPVLLLHGGLANSDYMSDLARALLAAHYQVIVVDSRGHGRSSLGRTPIGYDRMADDAVAVLTHLKIERAAVVGWSDGGIQGIDLALRHPDRVTRVFSFAPNITTDGVDTSAENTPTVKAFIARTKQEYRHLSPSPGRFGKFEASIEHMWSEQPNWSDSQVAAITPPMSIVDGAHDELINLQHIQHLPHVTHPACLLISPNTSHFAFLQNPELFAETVINFLKLPTP